MTHGSPPFHSQAVERIVPDVRKRTKTVLIGSPLTHERFNRRRSDPLYATVSQVYPWGLQREKLTKCIDDYGVDDTKQRGMLFLPLRSCLVTGLQSKDVYDTRATR